ncbi:response regulator [Paenibacillus sp. 481]|uniref:response regulator n=1 Tax=Paenibacillus sp. 481 TaxID=2835869 RepID=UPI001E54C9FE|nr:response regulator [Paenibacillus sp. 481]UHA73601.1 response regulator [Paenibacillus sp. 481]
MYLLTFILLAATIPFLIYLYFKKRSQSAEKELQAASYTQLAQAGDMSASEQLPHADDVKPVILIVDDQYPIRMLLHEALAEHNYEVREASTGQEALDFVRKQPCQLVLMDVKLPDQSGLEILRTMRTMRPQLNVIMISAYNDTDKINEAKSIGAVGFFSKPFDLEELRTYIASRL